ncbi:MAG: S8 family serine peptidase [Chloroflexi bacterium]|nr:S8 family serine peptidase [Chloroflexota bacterium]
MDGNGKHSRTDVVRKFGVLLPLWVTLLLVMALGAPSVFAQGGGPSYVSGELIVRYKTHVAEWNKADLETRLGDRIVRIFKNVQARVVKLGRNRSVEQAIQEYHRDANVAYAEPNYILRTFGSPDDAAYPQLWGLRNTGQVIGGVASKPGADIRAEHAWALTTGSASIVVGLLDTGVDYTHPDLATNIWNNPGGIGNCPAGTHGYNAITNTCDPRDDNKHGTHVAGTVGAVGNNGLGVVGVNWKTQIMALKFMDASGAGTTADAIDAIEFAINAKLAGVNLRVLNASWGGNGYSQALLDEIVKAGGQGILFVVAAGNNATNSDASPSYPCSYRATNLICVAATDPSDNLAKFSNYGSSAVHLGAPGVNILSTINGGGYGYFSGTSMATPHVSGAAALILSLPGQGNLSVEQLKNYVLNNVDPLPSLNGRTTTGGRLNVCRAMPGCGAPAPVPPPPTATATRAATLTPVKPTGTATRAATLTPVKPTGTATRAPVTPTRVATPMPGSFYLSTPRWVLLRRNSPGVVVVRVTSSGGFSAPVSLGVSGLPQGMTAAFSTNPIMPTTGGAISNLTITPGNSSGIFSLRITGVGGGQLRSNALTAIVW